MYRLLTILYCSRGTGRSWAYANLHKCREIGSCKSCRIGPATNLSAQLDCRRQVNDTAISTLNRMKNTVHAVTISVAVGRAPGRS